MSRLSEYGLLPPTYCLHKTLTLVMVISSRYTLELIKRTQIILLNVRQHCLSELGAVQMPIFPRFPSSH